MAVAMVWRKQTRLYTIHEQVVHLSFHWLKLLSGAGIIPKEIANATDPIYLGWTHGKAHRKPTRSKVAWNKKQLITATTPGQNLSDDKLLIPTPGFIPTHRGRPTTQHYVSATVFFEHLSDFTYIHLMHKLDGESTIKSKIPLNAYVSHTQ